MRYVFAECVLDTQLYSLYRAGTTVQLRPKAFHVLQYLLEHRDHVVNKDELCAHVWPGQFISDATLEGCITLARQAVGDSGRAQRLILEIEDLHWSDATSEEWLAAFGACLSTAPILVLGTYRPGYRPSWLNTSYATQLAGSAG